MREEEKLPQDIYLLQLMVQSQNELIATLKESLQAQTTSNLQLQKTTANLEMMVANLQQQVETLLRQLYGKKSEKKSKPKDEENTSASTSNKNASKNPSDNKKKGRRKLSSRLPRQRQVHDLPEAEKICKDCKGPLHKLGEEVSEQYEFVPAKLIVIEHARQKYACRPCGGNIILAPMPNQPIEKGLAGPGLLAEVLINKYEDALPLYRQEQRWQRLGIELSRSTLCAWVKGCAQLLEPLVKRMQETLLLKSLKIHSDDTPVPVQVKGKGKTHTGRLWVYVGGGGFAPPCTIYDYSSTRSQEAPLQFLKNYQGYLQADAYVGFDVLYGTGDIIECACWSHARRKFIEITDAVKMPSLADEALNFIGGLYDIERTAKYFSEQHRKFYRQRYAKTILKKFKRWLKRQQKKTLPKSPIGKAIQYTLNHWRALCHYLREGYLDIDNNVAERAIKPLVIGRNYAEFSIMLSCHSSM